MNKLFIIIQNSSNSLAWQQLSKNIFSQRRRLAKTLKTSSSSIKSYKNRTLARLKIAGHQLLIEVVKPDEKVLI